MTNFDIHKVDFSLVEIELARRLGHALGGFGDNWPVVYTIADSDNVYVGETLNAVNRMNQHKANPERQDLTTLRVIYNEQFNKSVCLDLESYLIRLISGEGRFSLLNRNVGIVDSNYYDRAHYREQFEHIFERLKDEGLFEAELEEIQNSDLFKLSPFKALTPDQEIAVGQIMEAITTSLHSDPSSLELIVKGDPGTGKTVVAIYILKMLSDIQSSSDLEDPVSDERFTKFYTERNRDLLRGIKVALVVPQQSLRETVERVFRRTPGLERVQVLTPFGIAESQDRFDLTLVDESHRLGMRSNQPAAMLNKRFSAANERLFGNDGLHLTQLDWIKAKSDKVVLFVDPFQTVKPGDLPTSTVLELVESAKKRENYIEIISQIRVLAGDKYIPFVKELLRGQADESPEFGEYEFELFDDLGSMISTIKQKDEEHGLSRVIAGYAWPWNSKGPKKRHKIDIDEDGVKLQWNGVVKDWINSPGSVSEVGSIHTVQGYDLNYAGVIIGRDLRMGPSDGAVYFDRSNYYDKKGKENNKKLGITYTDEDILQYVQNIYSVLMTRGIRGTYLYVCDETLREYMRSKIRTR